MLFYCILLLVMLEIRSLIKIKCNSTCMKLVLISFLLMVSVFLSACETQESSEIPEAECNADSDCVKDSCCHASLCVSSEKAPSCKGLFCTQECVPNTLDCGAGSCNCVNSRCEAVYN